MKVKENPANNRLKVKISDIKKQKEEQKNVIEDTKEEIIIPEFAKKKKKYNFEIKPLSNEDKKMFEKYINEYKDTAKEREITIYFNMLKLAIDTILIYYNTNGAKKSIEKVIKHIIKEYFFYLIY